MKGPQEITFEGQEEVPAKEVTEQPGGFVRHDTPLWETEKILLGRVMGLGSKDSLGPHANRIDKLANFARAKGAKDINEIAREVRILRNKLGNGANIHELSVYAGLEVQRMRIEREMSSFETNG